VCSITWTLVNRGSKYWQETVGIENRESRGRRNWPLFKQREAPQRKGTWLSGRPYSVSKLAIGVSDYVALVWLAIFVRQAWIALALTGWAKLSACSLMDDVYSPLIYGRPSNYLREIRTPKSEGRMRWAWVG